GRTVSELGLLVFRIAGVAGFFRTRDAMPPGTLLSLRMEAAGDPHQDRRRKPCKAGTAATRGAPAVRNRACAVPWTRLGGAGKGRERRAARAGQGRTRG